MVSGDIDIAIDLATPSERARFVFSDAAAWRFVADDAVPVLELYRASRYRPAVRSPLNIALYDGEYGSFTFDVEALQTGRDYAHRDLCLFFGYRDATHFYYAHLASKADDHAHSIFVVDGSDRQSIAELRDGGVDWGRDSWHHLRLERDGVSGTTRVYFDNLSKPILTANDKRFGWGRVGIGSFDDIGRFRRLRLRPKQVRVAPVASPFEKRGANVQLLAREDHTIVAIGGELFTRFEWKQHSRPILHPIVGPGGHVVTREWPVGSAPSETHDHPHHKSMWFAHGSVNGCDFWSEAKNAGQIITTDVQMPANDRIASRHEWQAADGTKLVDERRSMRFGGDDKSRWIDFSIELRPHDGAVTFGDTKEGMFGIRMAPALRLEGKAAKAKARNSEGVMGKAVWGKRARWVDYFGPLDGDVVGVAIFDNPQNLRYPTWWHARAYGLVAANPFGIHDFEKKAKGSGDYVLEAGRPLRFEYRIWLHADVDAERVEREWRAYTGKGVGVDVEGGR